MRLQDLEPGTSWVAAGRQVQIRGTVGGHIAYPTKEHTLVTYSTSSSIDYGAVFLTSQVQEVIEHDRLTLSVTVQTNL